jgi:hypothetical protein
VTQQGDGRQRLSQFVLQGRQQGSLTPLKGYSQIEIQSQTRTGSEGQGLSQPHSQRWAAWDADCTTKQVFFVLWPQTPPDCFTEKDPAIHIPCSSWEVGSTPTMNGLSPPCVLSAGLDLPPGQGLLILPNPPQALPPPESLLPLSSPVLTSPEGGAIDCSGCHEHCVVITCLDACL